MHQIRNVNPQDIEAIKKVIDVNELFPSELLDDMISNYFNNASSKDIWLTVDVDGIAIAVAFCAPEKFTEGTYNLYLIAVHKSLHGQRVGTNLIDYLEKYLARHGNRILIVETSGLPEFELTRKFYHNCNYTHEATIREFYREGEDKIVFWKKLN